jgi:hypothetical protein
MTGAAPSIVLRNILHGGALAVTGWALIATSAPDEPAHDCFTGLKSDTYLRVTLSAGTADAGPADAGDESDGSPSSADGGDSASLDAASPEASGGDAMVVTSPTGKPSCGGIDGLSVGSVLDFHLNQGPRPQTGAGCWAYDTFFLTGTTDVTLSPTLPVGGGDALTRVPGTFLSTKAVGCRGDWYLTLGPAHLPPSGQTVSPIDAGAGSQWNVVREISVAQAQFCNGAFTQRGAVDCSDTFPVESATEHSSP